jgi:4-hydroxy-3-methylbut-2-enyl diphosphate reductase
MKVLLAEPRGVCAGVDRAVKIVDEALARFGPPIYVLHEIVHNRHIVENFRRRGVIFVDELGEVPEGTTAIFSAHGVAPAVYEEAKRRNLRAIDATCPLVTKVHQEVVRFAKKGRHLILIGHEGHEEVVGTMGHAPDSITLVTNTVDANRVTFPEEADLFVVTQTTLSMDDTAEILDVLKRRFPQLQLPRSDDICYATQNRQNAVKEISDKIDLLLIIGSANSSNAKRLVEVGRSRSVQAHLVEDETGIDPAWLAGIETVGVSAGASTPEELVQRVLSRLRDLGATDVRTHLTVEEKVIFNLPPELVGSRKGS